MPTMSFLLSKSKINFKDLIARLINVNAYSVYVNLLRCGLALATLRLVRQNT